MIVNETQDFRGSIIMIVMLMIELPTMILLLVLWQTGKLGEEGIWAVIIVFSVFALTFLFIMSMKFELRIDSHGISYKYPPFRSKWMNIDFRDILDLKIVRDAGLLTYGGMGIKLSRNHRAFIFSTDELIEITLVKTKLVFSTNRAVDILKIYQQWQQE